jgi:hypothetical protein
MYGHALCQAGHSSGRAYYLSEGSLQIAGPLNIDLRYAIMELMKKTKLKLQLKKSTIRVLHDATLKRVVGGSPTEDPEYCSSNCNGCPTDASWCDCETTTTCM